MLKSHRDSIWTFVILSYVIMSCITNYVVTNSMLNFNLSFSPKNAVLTDNVNGLLECNAFAHKQNLMTGS